MNKARNRLRNGLIILVIGFSQGGFAGGLMSPASARAEDEQKLWLPIVQRQYTWDMGSLSGRVVDSSVADPLLSGLAGAEVCASPSRCTTSDENGYYTVSIPPGYWQVTAAIDEYYDVAKFAAVHPLEDVTVNFALSRELTEGGNVELRLVLTWSETPIWETCPLDPSSCANDLDAHLWVDSATDAHIQYPVDLDKCIEFPYACLEVDVRYGSGPETIAFSEVLTDTPTIYYFGIFNYNQGRPGVPPLSQTGAHLDIYNENGLLMQLEPPLTGDWTFWYTFTMAGETGVISPTNCMALFDPNQVDDFITTWEQTSNKVCP